MGLVIFYYYYYPSETLIMTTMNPVSILKQCVLPIADRHTDDISFISRIK